MGSDAGVGGSSRTRGAHQGAPSAYVYPRLSPDGTRIALTIADQEHDIWIWDLVRETPLTRLTFGRRPRWVSPGPPQWTERDLQFGRASRFRSIQPVSAGSGRCWTCRAIDARHGTNWSLRRRQTVKGSFSRGDRRWWGRC